MRFDPLKKEPWTIAILGGGPAGSSTALYYFQSMKTSILSDELSSHCEVHLYDYPRRFNFQNNRSNNLTISENICVGESIPPAATPILRKLGCIDIIEKGNVHLNCPGSISLWNDDKPGYNDFLLDAVGQGYHLEREIFDKQILTKACEAGVIRHKGWKLISVKENKGKHQLGFVVDKNKDKSKNDTSIVEADFVIDATGKSSAFARRLNVFRNVLDEVMFLCAFIELPEGCDLISNTLVESVAEGWWYAARLPNNKMIVTFCTDQQGLKSHQWQNPEKWLKLFTQTKWLKNKLAKVFENISHDCLNIVVQSAPSSLLSAVCGDNWLAVGDAASSYDPITSAGITKAMQQGEQAGRALASFVMEGKNDLLQVYQQQVFDDFKQYAKVRHELYASEKRFSDSEFWMRRLGRI